MDNLKKNKMIQAKELRIGNWIIDNGKQKQIHSISNHNARDYSKVEPIPITEEWLLKLGYWPCNLTDNHFNISGHRIWKCNDIFICDKNGIVLKYIHQLQNLYFALNQKELIFNG